MIRKLLPYIPLNHEETLPFIESLKAPVHAASMRNRGRQVRCGEVGLDGGMHLDVEVPMTAPLRVAVTDFRRFGRVCMELPDRGGYAIRLRLGRVPDAPRGAAEAYTVTVGPRVCRVAARDVDGLRRALIYLEDEMTLRRCPALPRGTITRWAAVRMRMSRSPYAPYRFGTGWELDHATDAYPREYLNRMAHLGVNGVWVAGIFRELIHSQVLPEMTVPKTRLGRLKRLVDKAAGYGIKVYLFAMEPRIQDDREAVFRAHPAIRGSKWGTYGRTLCTSHPLVLEYIEDVTAELFRAVPGLGGFINLFRGERTTACVSPPPRNRPADYVQPCPRCSARPMEEIYCDELAAFHRGMRRVSSEARLIAWNYGHGQMALNRRILKNLHPDILLMDTFEHDGKKKIWGKMRTIDEYALSYVGPSPSFRALQRTAVEHGKRLCAKIQIGHTFETPSMPYVPVPSSAYRKFKQMHKLGVEAAMQSWINGGFPSMMHKAAGEAAFAPLMKEQALLRRVAGIGWGEQHAAAVARAWTCFFAAYQHYPFSKPVFLYGPLARSPAYPLYAKPRGYVSQPYNWGIQRDRVRQPYDDTIERWMGCLTAPQLVASFRAMAKEWERGLEILRPLVRAFGPASEQAREQAVAEALCIQFRSCANVLEFYHLRDALPSLSRRRRGGAVRRMRGIAEDDLAEARRMLPWIEIEPAIGFQSEMQIYSFSKRLIHNKIRQVRQMLALLGRES